MLDFIERQSLGSIMWLNTVLVRTCAVLSVLLIIAITNSSTLHNSDLSSEYDDDVYPKSIPFYPIRKDYYTNETVTRDKALQINGTILVKNPKKMTPLEFRRFMQCKKNDFNIDNTGIIKMLKAMKLTRKGLIRSFYLVFMDDMTASNQMADELYENAMKISENCTQNKNQPFVGLFRLINSSLYFDHPINTTCMLPYEHCEYAYFRTMQLQLLLNKVHGYKDSIFGFGDELPVVNMMTPFPMFSSTSADGYNDLVYPWWEMMKFEIEVLDKAKDDLANFRSYSYPNQRSWANKHSKALLLCTLNEFERVLYYHIAATHPHLFEAAYIYREDLGSGEDTNSSTSNHLRPFNPNSDETGYNCPPRDCPNREPNLNDYNARVRKHHHSGSSGGSSSKHTDTITKSIRTTDSVNDHHESCAFNTSKPFYNSELEKFCSVDPVDMNPTHFKYIIVPLGTNFLATANRLGYLLGYSGAVILMAESRSKYHFSHHLKPWVNYVPFTYSGADLVEKIQWLRDHDAMAQRIAANAQRFADSHLRLEDYFCYWNHALEQLGDAFEGSEAVQTPFDPQPLCACPKHTELDEEGLLKGVPYCETDL